MHFSPEVLREQAQRLVDLQVKQDRSILGAYLRGSLLYGSPLIGGAGDVDLVFIHHHPPEREREIRPLTPTIHFDLAHHDQTLYHQPRSLRTDPWMGPTLHDAQPLFDPQHFIDYTQSSVRGKFSDPETVAARARPLLEQARQFWLDRQLQRPLGSLSELGPFLEAVEQAATAVVLLAGPPLAVRRLGLDFAERTQSLDPGLDSDFLEVVGGHQCPPDKIQSWIKPWADTLKKTEGEGHPLSQQSTYFEQAVRALLDSPRPRSALWPLLKTWTEGVSLLPADHALRQTWREACGSLGLAGNAYQQRIDFFDRFLDRCQSALDHWLGERGWS